VHGVRVAGPAGRRVTFTTGAIRVEPDRRHVTLPRIGTVRVHENTRRLERLLAKGRARILAVTVSRKGTRLVAAFRVLVQRPQRAGVARPDRRHPRLAPPPPDHHARQNPRRDRGRGTGRGRDAAAEGPARSPRETARPVGLRPRRDPPPARLQDRLARLPARDRQPVLPLVQDLPRVRARPGHRVGRALDLHRVRDSAPARRQRRRQPRALRAAPAGDSAVGPVRAAVKRRADRKTGPRPAGGNEARKGRSPTAAEQPRDGVPA
jgi:hypothetical protein